METETIQKPTVQGQGLDDAVWKTSWLWTHGPGHLELNKLKYNSSSPQGSVLRNKKFMTSFQCGVLSRGLAYLAAKFWDTGLEPLCVRVQEAVV